ncbi:MAG: hypothetical protein WD341_06020, partial [Tistlia sp.]|uniref:hypothetical protein n=1 Tax=Tistlia sp. TaxID=3057121 RepID=UPI0034A438D0
MTIENARYADAGQTRIIATVEGVEMTIPVDPVNRHYQALLAAEVEIAPAAAPDLAEVKAAALVEVDRQAEAVRLLYLTDGAGQAQEYAQTEA